MQTGFKVACIQNSPGPDIASNVDDALRRTREASDRGAVLACLPEFFSCLDMQNGRFEVGAYNESEHPALAPFKALAAERDMFVLLGSIAIPRDDGKFSNRQILLDGNGDVVARYDKIHLFDVDLDDGESYRESDIIVPGDKAVVADTPFGGLGLSICYDLRFAYLYRTLAHHGARYLAVPAAFMHTTGKAHWHALLRARAIETGSYVFAPCQSGYHGEAHTYGHSLIIDPWGNILAEAGETPTVLIADIDPQEVDRVRAKIPALQHDRDYSAPRIVSDAANRRSA